MYTASDIAAAIMQQRDPGRYMLGTYGGNEEYKPISLSRLMVLMYLCQGYFLATKDIPVFEEEIRARSDGPIIISVYEKFCNLPAGEDIYKHIDKLEWKYVDKSIIGDIRVVLNEFDIKYTDNEFAAMIKCQSPCNKLAEFETISMQDIKDSFIKIGKIHSRNQKKYGKVPVKLEIWFDDLTYATIDGKYILGMEVKNIKKDFVYDRGYREKDLHLPKWNTYDFLTCDGLKLIISNQIAKQKLGNIGFRTSEQQGLFKRFMGNPDIVSIKIYSKDGTTQEIYVPSELDHRTRANKYQLSFIDKEWHGDLIIQIAANHSIFS